LRNIVYELRKKNGIKQCDLAEMLGISRQTLCSIEKEHWDPSIRLAYKIAQYFEKHIEEIFSLSED